MKNVFSTIITNEQFQQLYKCGYFNETKLRNILIREKYLSLGKSFSIEEILEIIQGAFNYLSQATIRSIIYSTKIEGENHNG